MIAHLPFKKVRMRGMTIFSALRAVAAGMFLLTASAQAQTLRDVMTTKDLGMGGAYRTLTVGPEAVYGNPAVMALVPQYQYELDAAADFSAPFGFASLAIVDSTTPFAGGVATQYVSLGTKDDRKDGSLNVLALAFPLWKDFSLGVSGRYFLLSGGRDANAITVDTGLALRLFDLLVVSAAGHNLIDVSSPYLPRYFSLSAALTLGPLIASADVIRDSNVNFLSPTSWATGAELKLFSQLPIRAGYSQDGTQTWRRLSVGTGFEADGVAIDLAYRHEWGGLESRVLALSIRYKLPGNP